MHGSIFILLKKFIENTYDESAWVKLLDEADLRGKEFELNQIYADQDMRALLEAAEGFTGLSRDTILEKFGYYLVPDLIRLYGKYVDASWKTFDMIIHTEDKMHAAARESPGASPPILKVTQYEPNTLFIDYQSHRRMAALAIGIVEGIAAYYGEADIIKVTNMSGKNAEKVRIKVEKATKRTKDNANGNSGK